MAKSLTFLPKSFANKVVFSDAIVRSLIYSLWYHFFIHGDTHKHAEPL